METQTPTLEITLNSMETKTQTQATKLHSLEQCWNLLGGAGWHLLGLTKNGKHLTHDELDKLATVLLNDFIDILVENGVFRKSHLRRPDSTQDF